MRDLWLPAVVSLALAVASGVAYARRAPRHWPVTLTLALALVVGLAQKARDVWIVPAGRALLADPPPYTGWQRVAFHCIEQAGELLTPAAVAWVVLVVLSRWIVSWRDIAFPYAIAFIQLIVSYPNVRGDALARSYLVVHVASLVAALLAVAARFRRGRLRELTATEGCALMLIAFQGADLAVGAWRYGLYGDAYRTSQAGMLALYPMLAGVQLTALWRVRRA